MIHRIRHADSDRLRQSRLTRDMIENMIDYDMQENRISHAGKSFTLSKTPSKCNSNISNNTYTNANMLHVDTKA